MLVHIESGGTNISLSTLDRLAAALGVSFVDVVSDPARSPQQIEALAWRGKKPESHATLLGSVPASHDAQLWIWSLAVEESYDAEPDPEGWHEMVYVIEGRLKIALEEGERIVEAGGFAIYSSAQPYRYQNVGRTIVRFVRNVVA